MARKSSDAVASEIRAIRGSLRTIDHSFRRLVPALAMAVQDGRSIAVTPTRPRLSAKARASLVLQGRYMGYMRQLKPRQKAQVRKVREVKGVRLAIARAKQLVAAV